MNGQKIWFTIFTAATAIASLGLLTCLTNDKSVQAQEPSKPQVVIDDSNAQIIYANHCDIIALREELIFEFGLNTQSADRPPVPVEMEQRIVMNYFTTKRMLHALMLTIERHEQTFGELKLDVSVPKTSPHVGQNASKPAGTIALAGTKPEPRHTVTKHAQMPPPSYANFCRITGTPEEIILDYGLNPQPFGPPSKAIPVKSRIVMNFYAGKRLEKALRSAILRHEKKFGKLETDVQKRVK